MRLPVAAKMALQSAGANGGTPGSPTPPDGIEAVLHDVGAGLGRRFVNAHHMIVVEVALLDAPFSSVISLYLASESPTPAPPSTCDKHR
jgi:hypothetical protein